MLYLLEISYPSLVLFEVVKEEVIFKSTLPIEMLTSDEGKLDENEIEI